MRAGHMRIEPNTTWVNVNGTQIAYDQHGSANDPVILLIHGVAMTAWPMAMVEQLAQAGFQVLRMDNRDTGQSQKFDHLQLPNMRWQLIKHKIGLKVAAPYPLTDLMKDTVGVLDALNIDAVHVVGASMGGMVAQLLAINAPGRVKSLTSIMSHSGKRGLPGPSKTVTRHLLSTPNSGSAADRQAYHVKTRWLIGSPKYPASAADITRDVCDQLDRGICTRGGARQVLAILAAESRVPKLRALRVPSQIIHGEDDPLIPAAGGISTQDAIHNARLHLIAGMGHDLPEQLHNKICKFIVELANTSEKKFQTAS